MILFVHGFFLDQINDLRDVNETTSNLPLWAWLLVMTAVIIIAVTTTVLVLKLRKRRVNELFRLRNVDDAEDPLSMNRVTS